VKSRSISIDRASLIGGFMDNLVSNGS